MKDRLFLLAIFVLGVILYVLNTKIENSKCVDGGVMSSNKGLLVISVLFIVLPLASIGCEMRCERMKPRMSPSCCVYAMFFLLLGIVLISLGSVIIGKVKQCNADVHGQVKSSATNIVVIGVVAVVASAGYLAYSYKMRDYSVSRSAFDFPTEF